MIRLLKARVQRRLKKRAVGNITKATLASFGTLWVCVEMLEFFFEESRVTLFIANNWWAFLVTGIVIGFIRTGSPVTARISNTDVRIEIRIGDVLSRRFRGAVLIGSNTTFDTSIEDKTISVDSVQGQFTQRYFRCAVRELDEKIKRSLSSLDPAHEYTRDKKVFGNLIEYGFGTVAVVETTGRTAYFVAIARLNENKVAESNQGAFLDALPMMWESIRTRGTQTNIVCPVLGTGPSRLTLSRMDAIQAIVKSFIAAVQEGKFAEQLTIVVFPPDAKNLDFDLLSNWLTCECNHRARASTDFTGRPIETAAERNNLVLNH